MNPNDQHPLTDTEQQWRDEILGLPADYPPEQRAHDDAQPLNPELPELIRNLEVTDTE